MLMLLAGCGALVARQISRSHGRSPTVASGTVRELLYDHYAITKCVIKELPSYDDLNFHIILPSGQQYVLKFNLSDVQGQDLELENAAMNHLATDRNDPSLAKCIPTVVLTAGLVKMFTYQSSSRIYFVRMLTFMQGSVLARVPYEARTGEFLSSVGRLLGRCDCAFSQSTFPTKFVQIAATRNHFWDLRNALRLQKWTSDVRDDGNRALLKRAFALFNSKAGYMLHDGSSLRSQVTHNDGNDHNVIVSEHCPTTAAGESSTWSVVGLIDFGDIVHTNLICNLAVSLAYYCCNPSLGTDQDRDALNEYARNTAVSVVRGYHDQMPLESLEIDVLWWCMIGRICHSLASSAHRQQMEPENKYLVVSEAPFWQLLRALSYPSFDINYQNARKEFQDILK